MNKSIIAVPCFIALLGISGCNTTNSTYANNYPYTVGYVDLNPSYWGDSAYYTSHGWVWNDSNYWRYDNRYRHNNYKYQQAGYHKYHNKHHYKYHHKHHHKGHHHWDH